MVFKITIDREEIDQVEETTTTTEMIAMKAMEAKKEGSTDLSIRRALSRKFLMNLILIRKSPLICLICGISLRKKTLKNTLEKT